MMNGQLDETDQKILRHLQEDARMDLGRLAVLVHKTVSTVSRRITSLTEAGYIQRSVVLLDRKRIGAPSSSSSWSCSKNKLKPCSKNSRITWPERCRPCTLPAPLRQMGLRPAGDRRNTRRLLRLPDGPDLDLPNVACGKQLCAEGA